MKITAKFAGTCPACKGRFEAGAQVEWKKGQKARHVSCEEPQLALPLPQGRNRRRGYDDAAMVLSYVQEGLGEDRDFMPSEEDSCPF